MNKKERTEWFRTERERVGGMPVWLIRFCKCWFLLMQKRTFIALSVAALPSLFCDIKNRKTNTINICFLLRYFFMRQILFARISKFY
jgi:hypothetical protein